MIAEISPSYSFARPVETKPSNRVQNAELKSNLSKETVIDAGAKIAGATIIAIGLYKVVTADSINDLVVGGLLMYVGYKVFKHKSKKS